MKKKDAIETVHEIITIGKERGIAHLVTEDERYNGRTIKVRGKELLNFGSYSYLGLELDPRLKEAAKDAIDRYGIQYGSSRTYVSCTLYDEFEELLRTLFQAPIILANSTTLGHQAVMPIVVENGDAVILDQQVHSSVQDSAEKLKLRGVDLSIIRHNHIDELEKRIADYSAKYNRVWYMADGVYSMYGDLAPVKELERLLNKYSKFYLYIDDAHGMSWAGKNGTGYVLSQIALHPRMILATSLNKAFASGGAVFVMSDESICQKIKNCGGNLIFAGQHQVSALGAGIACAKIHLSDEIYTRQQDLAKKLSYCHQLLLKHNLPVISDEQSPISFIGLGKPSVGYNLVKRLVEDGIYVNLAIFPAVPSNCTGLRISITINHTLEDIQKMCHTIARHFKEALHEEGSSLKEVHRAFRRIKSFDPVSEAENKPEKVRNQTLVTTYYQSIDQVPKHDWNKVLGDSGMFDWDGLHFIEATFQGNIEAINNYNFHYYMIRDQTEKLLLATFCCEAMTKDDFLAPRVKSKQIEELRKNDPMYLVSRALIMGSTITEGEHLYIDKTYKDWQKVLMELLNHLWEKQDQLKLDAIYLRDFPTTDIDIRDFLLDQGFIKVKMPQTSELDLTGWATPEEYLKLFSSRQRNYLRREVLKYEDFYAVDVITHPTEEQIEKWYGLYLNVQHNTFELNGFDLPQNFFTNMGKFDQCDILQLTIKPEYTADHKPKVVSVTFNYLTAAKNYCGVILGLDYQYVHSHNLYKQTIYQSILRAKTLKAKKMYLGLTAENIKKKFGATSTPLSAYVQTHDTYSASLINLLSE